jgi:CRISPR system Cascade subunit CasE
MRERFGILYRLEIDERTGKGKPTLLVQSVARPDWTRLGGVGLLADGTAPAVEEISGAYAAISPNTRLRFRLRANPIRRVNCSHAGSDPLAGKRVELRDEEAQRVWLDRKGAQCGFVVIGVQVRPGDALGGKQRGSRSEDGSPRTLTFATVTFDGVLEVRNAELLRTALREGIGSGKAYGFGLLSLAPAPE